MATGKVDLQGEPARGLIGERKCEPKVRPKSRRDVLYMSIDGRRENDERGNSRLHRDDDLPVAISWATGLKAACATAAFSAS